MPAQLITLPISHYCDRRRGRSTARASLLAEERHVQFTTARVEPCGKGTRPSPPQHGTSRWVRVGRISSTGLLDLHSGRRRRAGGRADRGFGSGRRHFVPGLAAPPEVLRLSRNGRGVPAVVRGMFTGRLRGRHPARVRPDSSARPCARRSHRAPDLRRGRRAPAAGGFHSRATAHDGRPRPRGADRGGVAAAGLRHPAAADRGRPRAIARTPAGRQRGTHPAGQVASAPLRETKRLRRRPGCKSGIRPSRRTRRRLRRRWCRRREDHVGLDQLVVAQLLAVASPRTRASGRTARGTCPRRRPRRRDGLVVQVVQPLGVVVRQAELALGRDADDHWRASSRSSGLGGGGSRPGRARLHLRQLVVDLAAQAQLLELLSMSSLPPSPSWVMSSNVPPPRAPRRLPRAPSCSRSSPRPAAWPGRCRPSPRPRPARPRDPHLGLGRRVLGLMTSFFVGRPRSSGGHLASLSISDSCWASSSVTWLSSP